MLFTSILIFLVLSTYICSNNNSNIIYNRLGIISIIYVLNIYISSIDIISISNGINIYNNYILIKLINIPMIIIIIIFIIIWLIYSSTKNEITLKNGYIYILIITNTLSLIYLPLINDIMMLYIIIELQSYTLYIITGIYNKSFNSTKASILYFITGGIASTIILISIYILYKETGTMNLNEIHILQEYNRVTDYILIIGILFKMGMAPLHRWSISVYNYTPTYITTYISIVAKLSISTLIISNYWIFNNEIILIFIYISLFIGAYKPLYQINIKVILAYSGILNFGYILLSIISYDISYYIFIIQYLLTHISIFMILLLAGKLVNPVSKWSPLLYLNQFNFNNKFLLLSFIICMFSLIGIPPTPGFYSKLFLIESLLIDNYILEILLLIICSIISTYYYANIIKICVYNLNNNFNFNYNNSYLNSSISWVISILVIFIITFYLYIPYLIEGLMIIYI